MKIRLINRIAVAALATVTVPAFADETTLEEITVTATRRSENLQDVAASATVFSGDDLKDLGIVEPRDLAEQTPGLLTKYGPNGLATVGFYMRGVGINDFTGTVDPSVGVYVDEVFAPTPDMLNFAVYDIERVEVLRGPQGTLYGRNSTGGAVNFLSRRPTRDFEAYGRVGYGSYDTYTATGAVSGPLSDTLAGRLAINTVNSSSDSGYSNNRYTNNDLGLVESLALRGQLEWKPTDSFDARLIYNYGDSNSEQPLLQHVGTRDPQTFAVCQPVIRGQVDFSGACVDFLGYYDGDGDVYDGAANVNPRMKLDSDDFTLIMNWQGSRFTVTSISGYADFSKEQSQDIDASPAVQADNFTFNDVENFSQEFRVASDDSFRLPWIVGANYAKTDIDWFQTIDLTDLAGIPTSNGATQSTETYAVFGQLTIPLAEAFEFTGGLRYTDETREWNGATFIGTFDSLSAAYSSGAFRLSQLPLPSTDAGAGGPLDFPTEVSENKVDFSAVLKYNPTDEHMFYFSVSKAFRGGGYSSAVIFSQEALEPYDPEELTSYELGTKLSFAGDSLRLNASVFFYDFEGYQATFVRATEASARLQNAGDVEITGFDASLDWRPLDNLSLSAGLSLLDSEIVKTEVVLPPLDGGPDSTIKGNEIPNAPAVTFNGRINYELPLSDAMRLGLQTDFNYVDSHYLEPNNREYLAENGYVIVNARAALKSDDDTWEVALFARNLSDEEYRSAAQDLALALGFSEIVMGMPRTWGVEFEYRL